MRATAAFIMSRKFLSNSQTSEELDSSLKQILANIRVIRYWRRLSGDGRSQDSMDEIHSVIAGDFWEDPYECHQSDLPDSLLLLSL